MNKTEKLARELVAGVVARRETFITSEYADDASVKAIAKVLTSDAETIARLEKERAKIQALLSMMTDELNRMTTAAGEVIDRAEAAETKVRALREALEAIPDEPPEGEYDGRTYNACCGGGSSAGVPDHHKACWWVKARITLAALTPEPGHDH